MLRIELGTSWGSELLVVLISNFCFLESFIAFPEVLPIYSSS
jgi:hypothetical protein